MKPTILAIIGKPLSGKDTQADLLVAAHPESAKISPGQIFRDISALEENHRFWNIVGPYIPMMKQGLKLPDEPTIAMIDQVVGEELTAGKSLLVIAGSPRGMDQLAGFDEIARKNEANFLVVQVDATDAETYKRSATRNEGRVDDTPEVHTIRLGEYRTHVEPMVAHLSREGRIIHLDGMRSVEQVFGQLEQELRNHLREQEYRLPVMARR